MFQGDFGGPLVIRRDNAWTQIGVASFVPPSFCATGNPTAYVRVTSALNWIVDITGVGIE
jgi:secreted trypsin-like serine protease